MIVVDMAFCLQVCTRSQTLDQNSSEIVEMFYYPILFILYEYEYLSTHATEFIYLFSEIISVLFY